MADRIRFGVNACPIETLTDDNAGTHDIIASEVGKILGASGDSINLTVAHYGATANAQGYKDAVVNYRDALHTAEGVALTATNEPSFIYIRNTGFRYSSATTLGAASTDCVLVAIKEREYINATHGGFADINGNGLPRFYEVAWLKPGQAIVLPLGGKNVANCQYGSNQEDLAPINNAAYTMGVSVLHVRTYQSDGTASTDGNAIEFLAVT